MGLDGGESRRLGWEVITALLPRSRVLLSLLEQRWNLLREHPDERQRRVLAVAQVKVIGHGGISQVASATGPARGTIMAGLQEFEDTHNESVAGPRLAPPSAVQRPGGGRKPCRERASGTRSSTGCSRSSR
jgi:hypothetical protein